jgi:predicted DNA-binding protein with PD1-like motif
MKTFIGKGIGRVAVLNFKRGDLLLEGIRESLDKAGIKDAILLSAIGTLTKAYYHRITTTALDPHDEILCVEGAIELSSVDGIVVNGEPHLHMVFSDLKETFSGHLEGKSEVCYLAELVFGEIKGLALQRVADERKIKFLANR